MISKFLKILIKFYSVIIISVEQAFPSRKSTERKSMMSDIFYVVNRLTLSMSIGNTNQVSRDCWNAFFTTVNYNVRTFVNSINDEYNEGK